MGKKGSKKGSSLGDDALAELREDQVIGPDDMPSETKDISSSNPWALESLDMESMYEKDLRFLGKEFNERLWRASALGAAGKDEGDEGIIELEHKLETMFIRLRCSIVDTEEAFKIIQEAMQTLKKLKGQVGNRHYCMALQGLLVACLHEQNMGFHTPSHSMWDFDISWVNEKYALAVQGVKVDDEKLKQYERAQGNSDADTEMNREQKLIKQMFSDEKDKEVE